MLCKKVFLDILEKKTPKYLRGKPYDIVSDLIKRAGKDKFDFLTFSPDDAIEKMERIKISYPQNKRGERDNLSFSELTSHDILTSEFLADKIIPWIEEVRKKIFGSPNPPFDWDGAVEWIESEAKKGYEKKMPKELRNEIKEISMKSSKYYMNIFRKRHLLPYAKKNDEWEHNVPVNGPKLELLEHETRSMAKATGFGQQTLVIHVLSGIKLLVPRVYITTSLHLHKLSEQETLSRREIILKIRAKDFTFRELQRIYRMIRKEINLEKDKALNSRHLRIYNLITELGMPPSRGQPGHWKFWNTAQKKWNKKYPDHKYEYWQGIRGAFERIIAKLEKNLC